MSKKEDPTAKAEDTKTEPEKPETATVPAAETATAPAAETAKTPAAAKATAPTGKKATLPTATVVRGGWSWGGQEMHPGDTVSASPAQIADWTDAGVVAGEAE